MVKHALLKVNRNKLKPTKALLVCLSTLPTIVNSGLVEIHMLNSQSDVTICWLCTG